jgi:hypothetical protein
MRKSVVGAKWLFHHKREGAGTTMADGMLDAKLVWKKERKQRRSNPPIFLQSLFRHGFDHA